MTRPRRGKKAAAKRTESARAEPARETSTQVPAAPAAGPDEPAYSTPEENPETDVAPDIIGRQGAGRAESLETDVAPGAINRETPAASPDPETCTEPERDQVPAEDLH